jgi:hypothetical protein
MIKTTTCEKLGRPPAPPGTPLVEDPVPAGLEEDPVPAGLEGEDAVPAGLEGVQAASTRARAATTLLGCTRRR